MDNVPNLDGMNNDELLVFVAQANSDCVKMAKELFPHRHQGECVIHVVNLADYALQKAEAQACRAIGEIELALSLEKNCDEIYSKLPKFARW